DGAGRIAVGCDGRVPVAMFARQLDDVGRVVDGEGHDHAHAARGRLAEELPKLRVRTAVRIDLQRVGDPVAVVPGGVADGAFLHRLVLEGRGDPHGRDAEVLQVIETCGHAGEVAAVKV